MSTSELTHEEFEEILYDMEKHAISYVQNLGHKNSQKCVYSEYFLPSRIRENAKSEEEVPQIVKDIFIREEAETLADNSKEEEALTKATYNYVEESQSEDDFEEALFKAEQERIDNYIKRRKERTKGLLEAAKKFPDSRHQMLIVSQKTDKFILCIMDEKENFVTDLFNSISEWLSDAFNKIVDKYKEVTQEVLNFFGNLFNAETLLIS